MSNHSIAKTILCIHDNDRILTYQRRLLETRGYVVLTAASCRQATRVPAVHGVSAAIVGGNTPQMDSRRQIAMEIGRLAPQILLIIVSSDKEMPEHVLRVVDAFVSEDKPRGHLPMVITRVCDGHFTGFPKKHELRYLRLQDRRETSQPSRECVPADKRPSSDAAGQAGLATTSLR